ncbi:DUF6795 domain-containing protein [Teredinibacter turnerae]|uniref:DUF6795 domain-containing protein n=1 Tax=Teredinibacter turnerae TaxID=2426 RepID=UPI000360BF29|nr:DUF6795 domain-containing protein [Teredinibacter turnerae]
MNKKSPLIAILLIFLLLRESYAMSTNKFATDCLFSSISGVITHNGVPVAGATLKRSASKAHTSGEIVDEATTDVKGYFSMPALYERNVIARVLPMEFAISQKIVLTYNGNEYDMWTGVKRKREENAEANGEPLIVQCDLTNERKLKQVNGNPIFSICTWGAEEDAPLDIPPPEPDDE